MKIRGILLNGEHHELELPVSVQGLLDGLGVERERVAVEVNRRILKRAEFGEVTIREGDEVEIVTFVGGG